MYMEVSFPKKVTNLLDLLIQTHQPRIPYPLTLLLQRAPPAGLWLITQPPFILTFFDLIRIIKIKRNCLFRAAAKGLAGQPISAKIKTVGGMLMKTTWEVLEGVDIPLGPVTLKLKKPSNQFIAGLSREANK